MPGRWFNIAVVLLWLASMSWLVSVKVLPTLLVGQPPSYETILDAQRRQPPVGWKISMSGRQVGWAVSTTKSLASGGTTVRSRLRFEQLPLEELTPDWLRPLLRLIKEPMVPLQMNARSSMVMDDRGRLARFESTVSVEPSKHTVRLWGTVEGTKLRLTVCSGEFTYTTEAYLPGDALVGDALSPQAQLPGLYQGQTWTVPSYSPLRSPKAPLEILQATVEAMEPITWDGRTEDAWLVVYRADPGFVFRTQGPPRGRLWVRPDGTVLRQEVMSTMIFQRMTDEEAAELEATLGSEIEAESGDDTDPV